MRLTDLQEEVEGMNITQEQLRQIIYDVIPSITYYKVQMPNGDVTINIIRSGILDKGHIELSVSSRPETPKCDSEMFKKPMEYFLKELLTKLKHTISNTNPEILSGIKINYYDYIMFYKEGILNFIFRDLLQPSDKALILSDINLRDVVINMDEALSDLVIPENRLPRFDSDYSEKMDRSIHKMTTIYLAHKKGTFKGKPYTLPNDPSYAVLQSPDSIDNRFISSKFDMSITIPGYPTYDGTTEEKAELYELLKKKFISFGIGIN